MKKNSMLFSLLSFHRFLVAFHVLSSSNHQVCFALSLLFDVSLCNRNYCIIIAVVGCSVIYVNHVSETTGFE